ncbi:MAG: hypothetical protein H6R12_1203 [Proteobacteria bacterium]|nr:hypothetical protein [Pseudomonadota bacterium]
MYRALAVAVGFALIPLISGAQEANPYNGQWMARWKNPMGTTVEARVVIKDAGGTWRLLGSNRGDNCFERDFPLVVGRATETEFAFSVRASQVVRGCADSGVRAVPSGEKRLDGKFRDGTAVTLERQQRE